MAQTAGQRTQARRDAAKRYKSDPVLAEKRRADKRAEYARIAADQTRAAEFAAKATASRHVREADPEYRAASLAIARERSSAWYEANRAKVLASYDGVYARQYREANRPRYYAHSAARRAAQIAATPAWCDLDKVAEIFAECAYITAITGIPHEVDHYFPLRGKTVCGLHVPNNLRVITKDENRRKHARMPDDAFTRSSYINC